MKNKKLFDKLLFSRHSDPDSNAAGGKREFMAEQLESRVLYSAAPVGLPSDVAQEASQPQIGSEFESIESFVEASHRPTSIVSSTDPQEMEVWTSFDDMPSTELFASSPTIPERFSTSDIVLAAIEPRPANFQIVKLEPSYIEKADQYEMELDEDSEKDGWFYDDSTLDQDEFGRQEGLTALTDQKDSKQFGLDFLANLDVKVFGLDQVRTDFVFSGSFG